MRCKECGKEIEKAIAFGLCRTCYTKDLDSRSRGVCEGCGETKPIRAKGLCSACYVALLRYGDPNTRKRKVKGAEMCSKCEREPVHARGLCKQCYSRAYLKGLLHGKCEKCGEETKLIAKGLCRKCYHLSLEEKKSAICKGCGQFKPIKSMRYCRKCYARLKRHGHTNYTRPVKGVKLCTVCGKRPVHAKKMCSPCYKKYLQEKNPDKALNSRLRKTFGITSEEYYDMLKSQDNKCAICGIDFGEFANNGSKYSFFSVDHDHKTGEVRGLLCNNCNLGIGNLQDSPEIIQKAIEYLTSHSPSGNKQSEG